MKSKLKNFEEVRRFLDAVPYINSGGCGVAALAMYRWIKTNMPEYKDKVVFHFFHRDSDSYRHNKRLIKNNQYNDNNIQIPSHIAIEIKGITGKTPVDSNSAVSIHRYGYVVKIKSEDVLIKAINNFRSWNFFFYRKDNVPLIARKLKIDLSDIVTEVK